MYYQDRGIEILLGKTLTEVKQVDNEEILFTAETGEQYKMYHSQDCCESVYIESVVGDLQDLVGTPILKAEAKSSNEDPEGYISIDKYRDSYTWTFYTIATIKGYVDIRWLGESNGYYSESAEFAWINEPQKD